MKIIQERPPNWDAIIGRFPVVQRMNGVFFAWGDTIYNPSGITIPPQLVAHEEVHGSRQRAWHSGVEGWWQDYLSHDYFRFSEELAAHRAEWIAFEAGAKNRHQRRAYLKVISERLAGPLYGRLVTPREARVLVTDDGANDHLP